MTDQNEKHKKINEKKALPSDKELNC
jgi:hypothetical protein